MYPKHIFFILLSFAVVTLTNAQANKKPIPNKKPVVLSPEERYINSLKLKDDTAAVKRISPKPDTSIYVPKRYYIAAVIDATGTNDSIGFVLQPKSGNRQKLAFEGGTQAYFANYVDKVMKKDTTLYPVMLTIQKFSVTEERHKKVIDETSVVYSYKFSSVYKKDTIAVTEYEGHGSMSTPLDRKKEYDSVIRQFNWLSPKVDDYMKELEDKHPTFCKGVKVNVEMRKYPGTADSVFYDGNYQLSWDDYAGEAEAADGLLGYFTIDYDIESSYKEGFLVLDFKVAPVFVKSLSWVNGEPRKKDVLRHENYKFKLVYLYALQLKKRLLSLKLTYDNYRTVIPLEYKKMTKVLEGEITAYNKESNWGERKKEQARWEEDIDKSLEEYK